MGKSEKRNVTVFVVTGVLLAGGVGLGVWQVSSPTAPATTDTATTSTLSTTRAVDDSSTGGNVDEVLEVGPGDDVIEEASPSVRDDPFLAPNAVLPSAPEHSAPTTTYRPDNGVPLSPRYGDEPAAGSDSGAVRSEPSPEPVPLEPVPTEAPLQPETVPSSPAQPAVPDADPETTPEQETTPETESPTPEPTTSPIVPEQPDDAGTPSSPPQDDPDPTPPAQQPATTAGDVAPAPQEPAQATVDEEGSAAPPTPWERALSWFRG